MRTRLSFFVGKGGVGKTTVAAAYAVHRAVSNGASTRVALVSADTTDSLSHLLETELSSDLQEVRVTRSRSIRAALIVPLSLPELFEEDYQHVVNSISDAAFIDSEDVKQLLASAMPGLAEITSLFRIHELVESGEFDELIVDGAALGHSLRLLSTPGEFLNLMSAADQAADRDRQLAAQFGSGADLSTSLWMERWKQAASRVQDMFLADNTEIVLVCSPEFFSFNELTRALAHLPKRATTYVLNRVPRMGRCLRCERLCLNADSIIEKIRQQEPSPSIFEGSDTGEPVIGISEISALANELFFRMPRRAPSRPKPMTLRLSQAEWPRCSTPHIASFGKGGVGKTTLSAAAGYVQARREQKNVCVCSVDPSPSLDDVFAIPIDETARRVSSLPNLFAKELDPESSYRAWSSGIQRRISRSSTLGHSRVHIDVGMNMVSISALLEVVPPGVDEVFAVAELVRTGSSDSDRYVIDMAPSNHAIELLRSPKRVLAWTRALMRALSKLRSLRIAQDLAVDIAELSQRVRAAEQLLNRHCTPYLVTVAEATPYSQMLQLRNDLAAITTKQPVLFLNRILRSTSCPRCSVARSRQLQVIERAQTDFRQFYILPEFGREIIGERNIARFGRTILEV